VTSRVRKAFFLKKEAKTLVCAVADQPESRRQYDQKFFGSFFQKRTSFLLFAHTRPTDQAAA
jgi:hypothetical protein